MNLLDKPMDQLTPRDGWVIFGGCAVIAAAVVIFGLATDSAHAKIDPNLSLWGAVGTILAIRLVWWLVASGWWWWCVQMLGHFTVWAIASVMFGQIGFTVASIATLSLAVLPKVARWNDERQARELAARIRGERIDHVLKVFEDRLND